MIMIDSKKTSPLRVKKLPSHNSNKIFWFFRSIDENEKVCQNGCLPSLKPCPIGEKCEIELPWDVGIYG